MCPKNKTTKIKLWCGDDHNEWGVGIYAEEEESFSKYFFLPLLYIPQANFVTWYDTSHGMM